MTTKLQILNLALGKLSPTRVVNINPPKTPLETYMVGNYDVQLLTELTKRRWVFATIFDFPLTASEYNADARDGRQYKFALPNDCLRPIRRKRDEWAQRGKFIYTNDPNQFLTYVQKVDEADFDPLFIDVLASWIAIQSCMYVTESNTKLQQKREEYNAAVNAAKQVNAFVIGPEDVQEDDNDFSFLTARYV